MRGRSWQEEAATYLGTGHLRPAPGTWGSLFALPPGIAILALTGVWGLLAAVVAVSLLGVVSAGQYCAETGRKDPSEVVIDEVAGQWIALLPLGLLADWSLWYGWIAAFGCFRFFDVLKPWPCHALEGLPGGRGVMADDLMAGVYAALVVALFLFGVAHV